MKRNFTFRIITIITSLVLGMYRRRGNNCKSMPLLLSVDESTYVRFIRKKEKKR